MWDNFHFCNCNLATDWTENQTSFATDISNSGNKWSMLKNKGMHIIRQNVTRLSPKIEEIHHLAKSTNFLP